MRHVRHAIKEMCTQFFYAPSILIGQLVKQNFKLSFQICLEFHNIERKFLFSIFFPALNKQSEN